MTDLDHSQSAVQAERDVSRRTMLRGVAIGGVALPVLAACGGTDEAGAPADSSSSTSESGADPSASGSAKVSGGTKVPVADVPVGGGTILATEKIVVTQPKKGDFKAFDATCTHKGCTVKSIEGDQIVCPCHGSHFSINDGSPTQGPATAPLADKTATVSGGQISVA